MKIEHYLIHTDYPIWKVLQNRNGPVSVTTNTNEIIKVLPPKTAEEVVTRERERKAKTTLLMALLEYHLAKFHKMTDAKEMWEAIKSRFGGNDESKKMQKYLLKQLFEGFYVSASEGLHKRSLPSSWSQVALIMRTKPGLDTLSFDDLYNNLRVFERDVKGTTASSSSNTQNIAFVFVDNTSSTNDVSTAYNVSSPSVLKSHKEGSSSYTNEVIHSFFANQSSAPQLDYDDLEQINNDDMKEVDLKWKVAMISMRIKKFHKRTGRKRRDAGYNGNKARDNGRRPAYQDDSKALVTIDGEDIDWSGHTSADELDSKPVKSASSDSDSSIETTTSMPTPVDNALKVVCEPKVWTNAPIIEEYKSDSDDDSVSIVQENKEKPSFALTDYVKHVKSPRENSKETDTPNHIPKIKKQERYGYTRKGLGYTRKACFVYGSFSHLIRDCEFHKKIMEKQAALTKSKDKLRPEHVVIGEAKEILGTKSSTTTVDQNDPEKALKDKGIVDSGCSRHMIGNKAHLADYQEFKGGSVAFGGTNGRITGKGKIKADRLDFKDVYYVEELKHYNLFYVSQMCDKNNKVLFTNTDCLVPSPNFKLPDENQLLFKILRQHNMYSLNIKNINLYGDLACLFAKASIDESNKLHIRLGHVNFKNLNKLVKGNLVRGLPSKIFENDHTCVACQKGKKHKASYDADGVECLPTEEIFTELARMGYEKPPSKLTFYKAFFSAKWKFLIHTLVQCMSAKRIAWNEFSSSMARAIICLATGRKFNFSKYIFDSMVRNVDSPSKFLMYLRFFQVLINNQVDDLYSHKTEYTSPALTQKGFANMRNISKGYSGIETPLFATMLILKLKRRVKKLEKQRRSKYSGLKRLRKVGTSQRVESSTETVVSAKEDASNRREIKVIDANEDITLVDIETKVELDAELQETLEEKDEVNAAAKEVNVAEPTVFDDEEVTMTMAQTLIKIKAEKARLLDKQMAKRLHNEEVEQAAAGERQEQDDFKRAQELQQ
uniref:Ribonuclease H-like domain-containing protein n=1 Tax=Tanacetum cinerariifolium TaxID=118510 RepID=A0A6L2N055_TANCI|nr:ribonuclease H-like domain-containing protein [Tanacetum cinerariifolium]